jgi:hypothetical protein
VGVDGDNEFRLRLMGWRRCFTFTPPEQYQNGIFE